MKFDIIIGNPPFHEETKGNNKDKPLYHYFYDLSFELADIVSFITPGRFLFDAGLTPKKWNKKMLSNEHITVEHYEQKSENIFPNNDIMGGLAILLYDRNRIVEPINNFVIFKALENVLKKVKKLPFKPLTKIYYGMSSYKIKAEFLDKFPGKKDKKLDANIFSKFPEIFHETKTDSDISIYGRKDNQRVYRYVSRDIIENHPNLNKYKVFIPKSNGCGAIGEVTSTVLIGEPLVSEPLIGHTETFISFGAFDNKTEAENLLKYIKSKFARAMLGIRKITQDNATQAVWKYVPLQDFTENSDIDWTKSISEIDQQLYKKYGLSKEEINFIEEKVAPME